MNVAGKVIAAFIMLIVGISLIVVAAQTTNISTELSTSTDTVNIASARIAGGNINESVNFTLTGTGVNTYKFEYSECIPQTIIFKNSSGATLTEPTDYDYYPATAKFSLKNGTGVYGSNSNSTTATYNYCGDGYVTLGWGRSALDTGIGLFGVALLLGAVGLCFSIFKDFGFW